MREPPRLYDDLRGPVESALLEAGRGYRASHRARTQTLAALGLSASAAITAPSAAAVAASAAPQVAKLGWVGMGWAKLALGLSAVGALGGPVAYLAWPARAPETPVVTIAHTPPAASARREAMQAADPARVPEREGTAMPDVAAGHSPAPNAAEIKPGGEPLAPPPVGVRVGPPTTGTGGANAEARSPRAASKGGTPAALAAELAVVEEARSLVAAGYARAALAVLDGYARTYPRGHLEWEAEVLRMDALAKSGQPGAARKRAELFLRKHPNSVLANRVRGWLAD